MKLFPKLVAEFLGTFLLTLSIGVSITIPGGLSTPLVAALTLGTLVVVLGSISGTHINPAISIMLFTTRHLSVRRLVGYLGAQFLGGLLAGIVLAKIYGQVPAVPLAGNQMNLLAEILGSFVFGFGVSAVAQGKVPSGAEGFTVGGSLLLGISLAAPLSAGILNPAVALGLSVFDLPFILGPIIGAFLGGFLFSFLVKNDSI